MTTQVSTQTELRPSYEPRRATKKNAASSATRLALQWFAKLSPEKAGRLVNRMAFRPSRLPMPTRYEYLLDSVDGYTQLHHGAAIVPVYSWGQGPVILGVHGWSGAGIQFGAWINPLVDAGFRVVLFDAPAHGRARGERTDLYDMAEVVRKVAASVGQVHGIVAHSIGSIAAARAIADGLHVDHLVMLAPPLGVSAVMETLGQQLGLSRKVLDVHRQLMEAQFGEDVWQTFDMAQLAPHLPRRGLVVIDQDDGSISPSDSERVHALWKESSVLTTQGLGHHRMLTSEQVIGSVMDHLQHPVALN